MAIFHVIENLDPPHPTCAETTSHADLVASRKSWICTEKCPTPPAPDAVEHPAHYTSHPSGVECITVTEHMSFLRGNAVKYLWRAGEKGDALTDLRKARWYLDREIANLEREQG